MGVASIGWAVVSVKDSFLDTGVRVFPAGVDNFNSPKEKHPNQDRRSARGMRRRIRRKAQRKATLKQALQELSWVPTESTTDAPNEPSEIDLWHALPVYELRHRAVREKISLPELGRVILHLNQRRGFLSLRKSDEAAAEKESKGMLGQISELEQKIADSGLKTLGSYLFSEYQKHGLHQPIRNRDQSQQVYRHNRKMLHDEFSLIWETQQKFYPDLLTDKLRYGSEGPAKNLFKVCTPERRKKAESWLEQFGLENITFFQRRVYWPQESIGRCELEKEEPRAPVADRRFQEFRLLQEVNNIRITDNSVVGSPVERGLTPEEREEALGFLSKKDKPKIEELKKHLCKCRHLPQFPKELGNVRFNLENGGRSTISGAPTDYLMKSAKALGKEWENFSEEIKNQIIEALTLPAATDEDIRTELEKLPALTPQQVERLLGLSLPTGYGHLSIKALEKLLPHMQKGIVYMHKDEAQSAMQAAGYQRRDEQSHQSLETLPLFDDLLNSQSPAYDPNQVAINNPVVLRSLNELRKIVNALIRRYGKPSRIHLEMARDLKMSPKQRKEYEKQTRGFEKERAEAKKLLDECGLIPNRDAIQLLRLWKEQKEICPYSGKAISLAQLFSGQGEIDIDHIFPYSRSADDSMANKVVCHAHSNRSKGNQTPREWLAASDPAAYEAMLQRTKDYPANKRRRFYAEEIPEGFVNRDLNDTAWMAKAARQYLARLMSAPHLVQGTKGTYTALLRDHWELHSLLRHDGINLKNRDDHRHHALDAVVIALCDQSLIKQLVSQQKFRAQFSAAKEEGKKIYHLRHTGDKLGQPWPEFRSSVETSLNKIWVSHRAHRKVSGPLHKETNYGKTKEGLLVIRKAVTGLSEKEVEGIRDPEIKRIITDYMTANGGSVKCLKEINSENPLKMASGIPIRKVRTAIPYAHLTIRKGTAHETHVQSAATHHVAIFALGDDKYHFEPVSLYEASQRLRRKEPIVQKRYPNMPAEAEFLFHLCPGDSLMATIDGVDQLFIYKTMASTSKQVSFAYHNDGTQGNEDRETGRSLLRTCMPGTFEKNFPKARKSIILPDGRVRSAT